MVAIALPTAPLSASTDTTPAGMVAFFPQSECPNGWEPATYAHGRLLLGVTDLTTHTLGKQVGTALADLTPPAHKHGFTVTFKLAETNLDGGDCGGGDDGAAKYDGDGNGYTTTGNSANGGTNPPLFQILACEKSDDGQTPPPVDDYGTAALAFFNLNSCPTNWTPATDSKNSLVNGAFVMPFEAPPDDTVGNMVGTPYENGGQGAHTHSMTVDIDLNSIQYKKFAGGCKYLTSAGTQSFSGTTDEASNSVRYVQLLLCERDPNLSPSNLPTGVPTNIVTFFGSQNCPTAWKPSATGSGRFLVGLPDGGTPNESFGSSTPLKAPRDRIAHNHAFTGSVDISTAQPVALAKGSSGTSYGRHDTYGYSGTKGSGDLDLPYLTSAICQPCVVDDSYPKCQQQAKK
jgi:hypothetical protein